MGKKSLLNKYKKTDLNNITTSNCDNLELSYQFIEDFLRISGLEIDQEGYVVNSEVDIVEPEYIVIRGKALRRTNQGIAHSKDLIFDPYNNTLIIEELFRQYLMESHPEAITFQILNSQKDKQPKPNTFGYIMIMFSNGAQIQTCNHWKDSTKFLDAWMCCESYIRPMIDDILKPYDEYEKEYFAELEKLGL